MNTYIAKAFAAGSVVGRATILAYTHEAAVIEATAKLGHLKRGLSGDKPVRPISVIGVKLA